MSNMSATRCQGFSLVELIVILVVVSAGLAGLTGVFSTSSVSLSTNEIVQKASQYAQECAEKALAIRRHHPTDVNADGFDWFASNTFSCGTAPGGFTYSASSTPSTGSGTGNACPAPPVTNPVTTDNCRTIAVTATSTVNPLLSSTVTVLLVKTY